jgi:hypothetical protein
MNPRINNPSRIERGPEADGEDSMIGLLVQGYSALGEIDVRQTFDDIADDLNRRIESEEITVEQAKEVLIRLGFMDQ